MSVYDYDPDNWLVSTTRVLGSYVNDTLADPDVHVEMDFPDTRNLPKENPLPYALIHFAQDDERDPTLGFGVPGVEVLDLTDPANPTSTVHEAAMHDVNFDVGVWVSADMGGATKRMQLVQSLKAMFATAGGRQAFNDATGGLNVIAFDGGRNELDRINDLPVWRALDMTLVVRVFSRHISAQAVPVPTDIPLGENLTIRSEDGTDKPVVTP